MEYKELAETNLVVVVAATIAKARRAVPHDVVESGEQGPLSAVRCGLGGKRMSKRENGQC